MERLRIPRKALLFGNAALALAAIAAACGGGSEAKGPNNTGAVKPDNRPVPTSTAEPTIAPTATAAPTEAPSPTPEATPKPEPKKLAEATFVPTTVETVKESIDLAYQRHPDAEVVERGSPGRYAPLTRTSVYNALQACQSETLQSRNKGAACATLVYDLMHTYKITGYDEFYLAATNAHNNVQGRNDLDLEIYRQTLVSVFGQFNIE